MPATIARLSRTIARASTALLAVACTATALASPLRAQESHTHRSKGEQQ